MENKPIQIALAGRLSGVGEYYFSKKLREIDQMRATGQDIISLGVGGPDQPPHPKVIARLAAESAKPGTHAYQPYKGTAILREAFARWYNRFYGVTLDPVTEVLPLIGSKEGIMHVCMTYLNPGDKVLIPNPGYPTYRSAATIAGGVCVDYLLREQNGWMPDFAEIERGGLDGVKIMILLLHDNPYSFIRNEHPESLLATDGAKEVALELNSLSKSHSMAGWRIGMLAGAPERIDEVIRFKSNMDSGMFYPMQAAAAEALDLDEEWYRSLNAVYREREVKGFELLDLIGCSYAKPQSGLFVWGRLPEGAGDCFEFSDKLLYGCGVFITPGGIFGSEGNNYIRISLCSPVEVLERAKQRIREKM